MNPGRPLSRKLFPRFLALALSLSLALPNPALALRQINAGMEETPANQQLRASLKNPAAGLEETSEEKIRVILEKAGFSGLVSDDLRAILWPGTEGNLPIAVDLLARASGKTLDGPARAGLVRQLRPLIRLKEAIDRPAVLVAALGSIREASDIFQFSSRVKTAEQSIEAYLQSLAPDDYRYGPLHRLVEPMFYDGDVYKALQLSSWRVVGAFRAGQPDRQSRADQLLGITRPAMGLSVIHQAMPLDLSFDTRRYIEHFLFAVENSLSGEALTVGRFLELPDMICISSTKAQGSRARYAESAAHEYTHAELLAKGPEWWHQGSDPYADWLTTGIQIVMGDWFSEEIHEPMPWPDFPVAGPVVQKWLYQRGRDLSYRPPAEFGRFLRELESSSPGIRRYIQGVAFGGYARGLGEQIAAHPENAAKYDARERALYFLAWYGLQAQSPSFDQFERIVSSFRTAHKLTSAAGLEEPMPPERPKDFGKGDFGSITVGGLEPYIVRQGDQIFQEGVDYQTPSRDPLVPQEIRVGTKIAARRVQTVVVPISKLGRFALGPLTFQLVPMGADEAARPPDDGESGGGVAVAPMAKRYKLVWLDQGKPVDLDMVPLEDGSPVDIGREDLPQEMNPLTQRDLEGKLGPGVDDQRYEKVFNGWRSKLRHEPEWRIAISGFENGLDKTTYLPRRALSSAISRGDVRVRGRPGWNVVNRQFIPRYLQRGHLRIEIMGEDIVFSELGSTNGTYIEVDRRWARNQHHVHDDHISMGPDLWSAAAESEKVALRQSGGLSAPSDPSVVERTIADLMKRWKDRLVVIGNIGESGAEINPQTLARFPSEKPFKILFRIDGELRVATEMMVKNGELHARRPQEEGWRPVGCIYAAEEWIPVVAQRRIKDFQASVVPEGYGVLYDRSNNTVLILNLSAYQIRIAPISAGLEELMRIQIQRFLNRKLQIHHVDDAVLLSYDLVARPDEMVSILQPALGQLGRKHRKRMEPTIPRLIPDLKQAIEQAKKDAGRLEDEIRRRKQEWDEKQALEAVQQFIERAMTDVPALQALPKSIPGYGKEWAEVVHRFVETLHLPAEGSHEARAILQFVRWMNIHWFIPRRLFLFGRTENPPETTQDFARLIALGRIEEERRYEWHGKQIPVFLIRNLDLKPGDELKESHGGFQDRMIFLRADLAEVKAGTLKTIASGADQMLRVPDQLLLQEGMRPSVFQRSVKATRALQRRMGDHWGDLANRMIENMLYEELRHWMGHLSVEEKTQRLFIGMDEAFFRHYVENSWKSGVVRDLWDTWQPAPDSTIESRMWLGWGIFEVEGSLARGAQSPEDFAELLLDWNDEFLHAKRERSGIYQLSMNLGIRLLADEMGLTLPQERLSAATLERLDAERLTELVEKFWGQFEEAYRTLQRIAKSDALAVPLTEMPRLVSPSRAAAGLEEKVLKGHSLFVRSVAFSPDGKYLASGEENRNVILWDASSGKEIWRFSTSERGLAHQKGIIGVAFSPDGTRVAAALFDGTLLFIRAGDGALEAEKKFSQRTTAMAFSPDGKRAASGGYQGLQLLNVEQGQDVPPAARAGVGDVHSLAFSPDGKRLAVGGAQVVHLIDLDAQGETGSTSPPDKSTGGVQAVAFSPDGNSLAYGDEGGTTKIWDLATNSVRVLHTDTTPVRSIAFSPDGTQMAVAHLRGIIPLLDTASGNAIGYLEGHRGIVHSVVFSPDGKTLASGSADKTVRLWRVPQSPAAGLEEQGPAERLEALYRQYAGELSVIFDLSQYVPPAVLQPSQAKLLPPPERMLTMLGQIAFAQKILAEGNRVEAAYDWVREARTTLGALMSEAGRWPIRDSAGLLTPRTRVKQIIGELLRDLNGFLKNHGQEKGTGRRPAAGLEEIQLDTVAESLQRAKLKEPGPDGSKQILVPEGATHVVLIPDRLLRQPHVQPAERLQVYVQVSMETAAVAVLPWAYADMDVHPSLPDDPAELAAALEKVQPGRRAVIVLNAALQKQIRAGEILPKKHDLTLLVDPGKWGEYMDYKNELVTLLFQPPDRFQKLQNWVLLLKLGSVVQVTIDGEDFTAIFA